MISQKLDVSGIPAILWGAPSDKVFIYVHGKFSRKEYAERFADIAETYGWQTLSFDLPEHGERRGKPDKCDIWNGVRDLDLIADRAFGGWKRVSLFACSLGAYFALNAYPARKLEKVLFQSPIVDMKWLVEHMMLWAGVTPGQLEREKLIDTPLDTLNWEYYRYILTHPSDDWPFPTRILYAGKDDLQPEASVRDFARKHNAVLTVAPESRHPFMEPGDEAIVEEWIKNSLE
ncbi:MAG: alpha/beta hydrolase [Clostridiales bacterium]|nr:alpha/beta hydrolase [Clostridiales bacterium]